MKIFALRAALAVAILMGMAPALAQSKPQLITIPVSRPGEPVSLEIDIMSAHITVIGEDRADAEFEVTIEDGEKKIVTPSGTQTLSGAGFSLEVDEHDNEISVDTDWRHNKVIIVARIPRVADLYLSTLNDGEIIVSNVSGNLELSNVNGPVTATGISGSVIAESVSDTIDLSFSTIADINVSSMETVSGDLNLRLPTNVGVQVHLDTSQGEIISEFEVEVQPSTPTIERNDDRGGVEIRIESVIIANINGGGPIVRMKSLTGDINILKAD